MHRPRSEWGSGRQHALPTDTAQGSNILSTLVALPSTSTVHAISRRGLPADLTQSSTLRPHIDADTQSWPKLLSSAEPLPSVFFSGLGTTRGQAGSVAAQRNIDYDLNLSMAKAAKDAGVSTYVLISVSGASAGSLLPYPRMKGELDDAVSHLGFKNTIIIRPGLLVGNRDKNRIGEAQLQKLASALGGVTNTLKDFWAQDADVVAKAAIAASRECASGKRQDGVWIVNQAEIVRLGRTEWNGSQ